MNTAALREELQDAKAELGGMLDRITSQAEREQRPQTESERASIRQKRDRVEALERQIGASVTERNFTEALERQVGRMTRDARDTREGGVRGSTLGAQFARASGDWLKDPRNRGSRWESPVQEFDDPRFGDMHNTTITTTQGGAGGVLVAPQYLPGIVPVPLRPPIVADLLGAGTTGENMIISNVETAITVNAAAVAEGATKPEGAITFAQVQEPVAKLAWWIPCTEELLADLPAMRDYVDTRLVAGLQVVEDDQLLSGDGTAPNLKGLLNRTGLAADVPRGTDTNVDAIAKQIAAIETANPGVKVTGVIAHPTNYLTSRLQKTTTNEYIGGSPFEPVMPPALWGLPVALTTAIPLGTALVVCRSAAMVFRRTGILIAATNSHQDFFIKNLVAIRCEERLALCVFRPSCFGRVTGLS